MKVRMFWIGLICFILVGNASAGSLVGHWKLDGNADDSSTNGNHGVAVGGSGWVAGMDGLAADLDGSVVDQYIRIDDSNDYKLNKFTVACWLKVDEWGSGSWNQYVAFHNDTDGWGLSRNLAYSNSCLMLRGPAPGIVTGTNSVDDGSWHHVAATWDGTAGELKIYFDGQLENTATSSGSVRYTWTGDIPVVIGGRIYSDPVTSPLWLAGRAQVDDVRIYDYALNYAEIGQIVYEVTGWPYCSGYPAADLNYDCRVNFEDLKIMVSGWLECNMVPDCL